MTAETIIASFTSSFTSHIAALQRIEAKAASEVKNESLIYDSVADWPLEKLFRITHGGPYRHRAGSPLLELAGSLQSLIDSRHYLAGGSPGAGSPESQASALKIVAALETAVRDVPEGSRWVPVAACREVAHRIRTE